MDQLRKQYDRWMELDINKKAMSIIGFLAAVVITIGTIAYLTKPDYVPLNREISSEQIPEVINSLEANSIAYTVDKNNQISVDKASLDVAYSLLAKGGFSQKSASGYDHLLNGSTAYTSQIKENLFRNQVHEEELANLIMRFDGVADAKVKLALSKESQFLRDAAPAKASVVITTKNNIKLTKQQVDSIVQTVSGGIPNLPASNVIVTDQFGKLLSLKDDESTKSGSQIEYKSHIETSVEQKITTLLMPILGFEAFGVSVEAEINFNKVENTTDQPVEPSMVVSSFSEIYADGENYGAQGVAGALSNQPPAQAQFEQTPETASPDESINFVGTKKATTNYEIGRSITHTKFAGREVEQLSVSILIDESFYETPEIATAAIEKLLPMISSGIGLNEERGDEITITMIPFMQPEIIEEPPLEFYQTDWFAEVVDYAKVIGAIFILWLLIWRPLFGKKKESSDESADNAEPTAPAARNIDDLINDGLFDIGSSEQDANTINDALQSETNAAYTTLEQQAGVVAVIFRGWLAGNDFNINGESKQAETLDEPSAPEGREALMEQLRAENPNVSDADLEMMAEMMSEEGAK